MESGAGAGDAFAASTAPLTWHDFLERMRHPSAAEFVKSIKSFIVSFTNRTPDPEKDSNSVQEFLVSMEEAFRAHSLWVGSSEEELESAGEGLEKYLMTKLFNRVFASVPEDANSDEELHDKMALLQQFIRPENLDIKPNFQNEASWLLAQKELQKINMYKAPRDKLVCILNCCKVINNLLINASIASYGDPPGADEFLPVLIYVVIKANPPQLHSNLLYIQRYRRQSRLVSEAAYFFTNMLSAESFIWNIDAQALSMDEAEFQMKMDSAKAHLLGQSTNIEDNKTETKAGLMEQRLGISKANMGSDDSLSTRDYSAPMRPYDMSNDLGKRDKPPSKTLSISDIEKKGATELAKDDNVSKYFQEFPFLYARAGDLTVDDVESLLDSYKQLVLRYVSLARGMGVDHRSFAEGNLETLKLESGKEYVAMTDTETKNDKLEDISTTKESSNEEMILAKDETETKENTEDSVAEEAKEKDTEHPLNA